MSEQPPDRPTGPRQGGTYDSPDLAEPDLPRTAKVRTKGLRTGWTTGTCASAAARAAALCLVTGEPVRDVDVALPGGNRVSFAVEACRLLTDGRAEAVVVKDAGDDPDVTDKAHLTASVGWATEPGLDLRGGDGVGTVTKPGLGLDVGGPAINSVPRAMITAAVSEVIDAAQTGVVVVISVPEGERMARRTTNARLGIVGGISILGTTGIVRPFSTASWRASVEQAVRVMGAQGEGTVVLCTGGRTEKAATRLMPDLPEVCFVEVGDFTGHALRTAVEVGVGHCVFVGMAGKLTKLASGVLMTHYTRSRVDVGQLGDVTRVSAAHLADVEALAVAVDAANTGRHAYELWAEAGVLAEAGGELCRRVQEVLERFTAGQVTVDVAMVDFAGQRCVASTRRGWAA